MRPDRGEDGRIGDPDDDRIALGRDLGDPLAPLLGRLVARAGDLPLIEGAAELRWIEASRDERGVGREVLPLGEHREQVLAPDRWGARGATVSRLERGAEPGGEPVEAVDDGSQNASAR